MEPKVNLYIHISKTAGTTMRHILRANFPEEGWREIYPGYQHRLSEIGQGFRGMIIGHLDWSCLAELPAGVRKFSMLRHPTEQVVSHYIHLQKQGQLAETDFGAFLQTPYARNWQCQYLSGFKESERAGEEEAMYRVARENLHELTVCGITEEFEASVILFKKALDLRNTAYHNRNRSKDGTLKQELIGKFAADIAKVNRADLQLYREARERLQEQVQQSSFYFFHRLQHRWQQYRYRSRL